MESMAIVSPRNSPPAAGLYECTLLITQVLIPCLLSTWEIVSLCMHASSISLKLSSIHNNTLFFPLVTVQLEGWDRIIAAADAGEDHLDVLIDVLNEYYKNTERHHEPQVSKYFI